MYNPDPPACKGCGVMGQHITLRCPYLPCAYCHEKGHIIDECPACPVCQTCHQKSHKFDCPERKKRHQEIIENPTPTRHRGARSIFSTNPQPREPQSSKTGPRPSTQKTPQTQTAEFSTNYRLLTSDPQATGGKEDNSVWLPKSPFSMVLRTFRTPTSSHQTSDSRISDKHSVSSWTIYRIKLM